MENIENQGFGLNTNILETNILNLLVVLAVVFIFGGNALRGLLDNRKQAITTNLEEADKRAKQSQEKLAQLKNQLNQYKIKADEILKNGQEYAKQERITRQKETEDQIARLKTSREKMINLQREQVMKKLSQQVMTTILSTVTKQVNGKESLTKNIVNNAVKQSV